MSLDLPSARSTKLRGRFVYYPYIEFVNIPGKREKPQVLPKRLIPKAAEVALAQYLNTPPRDDWSPSILQNLLNLSRASGFVRMSAIMSSVDT
jgi:hypothetical protein